MILHSMFIGRKIQGYYSVQNASISQRRTLQMIRRSPTADERRIYVLPQHCENILLVFQLGDTEQVNIAHNGDLPLVHPGLNPSH